MAKLISVSELVEGRSNIAEYVCREAVETRGMQLTHHILETPSHIPLLNPYQGSDLFDDLFPLIRI